MKLKYLGTAAAEGFPSVFCACDNCRKAWHLGGRNIRSRSQAVIDGKLLIDFPADTFYHTVLNGMDLTDINHCLITHIHSDHLCTSDLLCLGKYYAHPPKDWEGITFYGSEDLGDVLQCLEDCTAGRLHFQKVVPFEPFSVGDYTVTALKATHGTEHPYIYIVSDGKKNLLYGHDTDIFPEETWEYLKERKLYFSLVSLDCTEGAMQELPYVGHMCFGTNVKSRELMIKAGHADSNTKFVLNHFSHNGMHACYDDFVPIAQKENFEVAYDGMEVTV